MQERRHCAGSVKPHPGTLLLVTNTIQTDSHPVRRCHSRYPAITADTSRENSERNTRSATVHRPATISSSARGEHVYHAPCMHPRRAPFLPPPSE